MNVLQWLLKKQFNYFYKQSTNDGFTLIELLVAMLLAVLVITPLMGVMISMLETDRREQAKANSEQEIQAATDYIARDLQQAIYIYDATGVDAIKSQLPTVTNGIPVLVFWKREISKDAVVTKLKDKTFYDDAFVNSLVAYYLIQDKAKPWSKAARIARFQIKDGVLNKNGSKCTKAYDTTSIFSQCPDDGFQVLNLSQKDKTLAEKMNSWTKTSQAYTQKPIVLIDFVDQSATTNNKEVPSASCPSNMVVVPTGITMTGFYACVTSLTEENRSIAEIYLRGNALARLTDDESKIIYSKAQNVYFPTTKIRVEGRSFIFSK
ncbi:prepilin-type N-terminal cleavage/methylation domain-containing protein [Nostoc sp. FACHB-87]|uniref:hormogonium polysaccharide secretion pseudopilin HpsC n=1 Tax=Nostocales TaxID=1161 RepID=UPI00168A0ADA|nr:MULTISPECIES: hormogonium polysaccharide secretion pseudopilin HpsC [Nostocales]MBD2453362.1 prepilin-type N-terminal cleavage/methylation domain-containing protein [Nostoc sp. FACHB-87]MBD2475486.1 prepilin-type N-terminal cleavage/methylation domain-containing protein [Anabaena sp. FACHB-83]MBD2490258.1 prepilin-type N-terminal cleavage/methylation domain-containing protein [Aulosira sp. FACHB-615]